MSEESAPLLTPRERDFLARNPETTIIDPPTDSAAMLELKGVEGWLGFLAVSLVMLGPLITSAITAVDINDLKSLYPETVGTPQWNNVVAGSWAATIAYSAISIFAGYRLFKHHVPRTVPIVIACMWVDGPILGILTFAMFEGDARAGGDVARSVITTGVWTAYLLRSKRVKNTYGRSR